MSYRIKAKATFARTLTTYGQTPVPASCATADYIARQWFVEAAKASRDIDFAFQHRSAAAAKSAKFHLGKCQTLSRNFALFKKKMLFFLA